MKDTIFGLSNHAYHFEQPYSEYLSSSQLKWYSRSPKFAKYQIDNPQEEKSEALAFGSLFHDLMAAIAEKKSLDAGLLYWYGTLAVFQAPINEKTGQPYGAATKAYKEAYDAFLTDNADKVMATEADVDLCLDMATSLYNDCGTTSEQVRKLLRWGKPEVSHFIEYEGCKFKYRPDLEATGLFKSTGGKFATLVDWKTVGTDDLSEESVNKIISKYGYDISASFYQFFYHEAFGVWPDFLWVFISKVEPYDCVIASAEKWAYSYNGSEDIVYPGIGAMKFRALLDQHIYCVKNNCWEGASSRIMPDFKGRRIMTPEPPAYENWKQINFYNNEENNVQ